MPGILFSCESVRPDPIYDNCRTLVDHHLILEPATSLASRTPFPIGLVAVPQVEVEAATRCLVAIDMLVEGLMAESTEFFTFDPSADLFGAPLLLAQFACREIQQCGVAALPAVGLALRVPLGLYETVVPANAKPAQLAAHRRGMLADRVGDLLLWRTIAVHGFDGVALLTGQAAVGRHGGSAWSLNHELPTAPGPLPITPIALAA